MIKKVLHKNIDREKYSECLQNSENYRIYAEDWYLDVVSEKRWDCYVYGDYEAVMPIPYVRKFGVKFILQPILCQQLGVFSKKVDEGIFKVFEAKIKKSWVLNYHFNEENSLFLKSKFKKRDNFLLELHKPYEEIKAHFRRDRQKDIRRIEKLEFEINREFIPDSFRKNLSKKYPHLEKFYSKESFIKLLDILRENNLYSFLEMKSGKEVIASLFICHSGKRRILLLSTKDVSNAYKGAFAYLLNLFIKENSESSLILDFEGSMIETIADFNKSFGAKKENYFSMK